VENVIPHEELNEVMIKKTL